MEFVFNLLPLAILGAIIAAVVSAFSRRKSRRSGREDGAPGMGTRQVFFYLFSFTALMVAASGGTVLVSYIVDLLRDDPLVSNEQSRLALGIALTVVGTPAWLLTWQRLLKASARAPHERMSDVRGLYIYVVLLVSFILVAIGLTSLVDVLLGGGSLSGTDISFPVIWGMVWGYHWWLDSQLTKDERAVTPFRSIYVHVVSLVSLVMLLVGIGIVIERLIDRLYVELFLDDRLFVTSIWSDGIKTSIAVALVGGLVWWWHWLKVAQSEPGGLLRQLYNYIFGVLSGVVTVVVSVSLLLVIFLLWALSAPGIDPAGEHFRTITGIIPSLLAGVMLWGYHGAVLKQEPAGAAHDSAQRVYNHVVSGLSLATLASGMIFLIALFISAASRGAQNYIIDTAGWQGQLSVVIPLLLVGGGIWGYYWWKIQRAGRTAVVELHTTSRRIHIYSVFGVSALAALASLSTGLFLVLQAVLDSEFSASTFQDAQWTIAVLVTSGIVSGYFWFVIQEDRRLLAGFAPEPVRTLKRVTALVPETMLPVVREIEERLGHEVTVWFEEDGVGVAEPSAPQLDELATAISSASADTVLVVTGPSGLQVKAYRSELESTDS